MIWKIKKHLCFSSAVLQHWLASWTVACGQHLVAFLYCCRWVFACSCVAAITSPCHCRLFSWEWSLCSQLPPTSPSCPLSPDRSKSQFPPPPLQGHSFPSIHTACCSSPPDDLRSCPLPPNNLHRNQLLHCASVSYDSYSDMFNTSCLFVGFHVKELG